MKGEEIEEDQQNILAVYVWMAGTTQWEITANFQLRAGNDKTIVLVVKGLNEKTNYDVCVLCKGEEGKMMLFSDNTLYTESK